MDSLELDVISKLNNTFLFNFKFRNFSQFQINDALSIYQFLFRVYDPSWVLKDEKPSAANLKQIQNYFQRLELGHLVSRPDDLVDNKKLCRLLGGLILKLESRYNGSKNLGAAVRKVRNQKVKLAQEKPRSIEKPSRGSSQDSTGDASEENIPGIAIADVIPNKGREIPRTPDVKSKQENPNQTYKTDPLPPSVGAEIDDQGAKAFQPILPTKEIPRTPLSGNNIKNGPPGNRNLNFTYEFSPLVSNASTPYSEKPPLDATYVVPLPPQALQKTLDLSIGSDSVFSPAQTNAEAVNATFPVQRGSDTIREPEDSPEAKQPQAKTLETDRADEGPFDLTMDEGKINTEKRKGFRILSSDSPRTEKPEAQAPNIRKGRKANPTRANGGETIPEDVNPPEPKDAMTGDNVPENPSDRQRSSKKNSPKVAEVPRSKANGKADQLEQTGPEQAAEPVAAVPELKRARGKGRKEKPSVEDPPVEQGKDLAVPEGSKLTDKDKQVVEQAAPEVRKPRGRGQKASAEGDKDVPAQEQVNAPVPEPKKPRGKAQKPSVESDKEAPEQEKAIPPVPEPKKQRVKAQKPPVDGENQVLEQEKTDPPVPELKKPRGQGQKPLVVDEQQVLEQEKSDPPVPEPKKQRGKAQKPPAEGENQVLEQEKTDPPVPEQRKQRGKAQKPPAEEEEQVLEQGKVEPPVPEPKKQREKVQKPPAEDEKLVLEQEKTDPPVPEPKRQRGKPQKPLTEVSKESLKHKIAVSMEESSESLERANAVSTDRAAESQANPVPEVKKPRGRGQKPSLEDDKAVPPLPEPKKQRGRAARGIQQCVPEQQAAEQLAEASTDALESKKPQGTEEKVVAVVKPNVTDVLVPESKVQRGNGPRGTRKAAPESVEAEPESSKIRNARGKKDNLPTGEEEGVKDEPPDVPEPAKGRGRGTKGNPRAQSKETLERSETVASVPKVQEAEHKSAVEVIEAKSSVPEAKKPRGRGAKAKEQPEEAAAKPTEASVPEGRKQQERGAKAAPKSLEQSSESNAPEFWKSADGLEDRAPVLEQPNKAVSPEELKPRVGRRENLQAGQIQELLEQSVNASPAPVAPKQRGRVQRQVVEQSSAEPAVPEPKKPRGRGKKDVTPPANAEVTEEAVPEPKTGRGRGRKEHLTPAANPGSLEQSNEAEASVPEPKKQRGKPQKDNPVAGGNSKSVEQTEEVAKVPETKRGRGSARNATLEQSKAAPEVADKKVKGKARKEDPAADETTDPADETKGVVPEAKKPRGRGRKEALAAADDLEEALEEPKPRGRGRKEKTEEIEKSNPADPSPEAKKPKGKGHGEAPKVEHDVAIPAEAKRGRGKNRADALEAKAGSDDADSAGPEAKKVKMGADSAPPAEAKKKRGRGRKEDPANDVSEQLEVAEAPSAKKPRGRGKPVEATDPEPEATPAVTGPKGRGSAKGQESSGQKTASGCRGKKNAGKQKPANMPEETPEFVEVINGKASTSQTPAKGAAAGKRIQLFRNSAQKATADGSEEEPSAPKRPRGKKATN